MNIEKLLLKAIFILMMASSFAVAGQAISGNRTFTQPDGTKFEGILKGDSSFHWIESNGNVVVYNAEDKFYYKAVIDINKGLMLTNEKPAVKINGLSSSSTGVTKKHDVTQDDRKNLYFFYKKSKSRSHPK